MQQHYIISFLIISTTKMHCFAGLNDTLYKQDNWFRCILYFTCCLQITFTSLFFKDYIYLNERSGLMASLIAAILKRRKLRCAERLELRDIIFSRSASSCRFKNKEPRYRRRLLRWHHVKLNSINHPLVYLVR